MTKLRFFSNNQIDKKRWDQALSEMKNTLVYPYSYYLDAVTRHNWGAFIGENYSWLFPVFLRYNLAFKDVRQPMFTQQLGLYANNYSQKTFENILYELHKKAHLVNIQTHQFMQIQEIRGYEISHRSNFELNLNKKYDDLKTGFSSNTKRNLKKSRKIDQKIVPVGIDEFLTYYATFRKKMGLKNKHLKVFRNLLNVLEERGQILLRAVQCKNDFMAVAAWCLTEERIYYLAGVSDQNGMTNRSMFMLQNWIIEKYAGQKSIYDFEGSMVDGVARFFAGFGAKPVTYYQIYKNELPFFLKQFH